MKSRISVRDYRPENAQALAEIYFNTIYQFGNKTLQCCHSNHASSYQIPSQGATTVQVVHVHNEGQAIVAQNVSAMGGGMGKKSLD